MTLQRRLAVAVAALLVTLVVAGGLVLLSQRRYVTRQLDAQVGRETADRKKRVAKSNFRVIEGGRSKDDDDKGPDGRWLN